MSEFEVWQGLANLYSSLSYWRDAEICLQKAKALKTYSATTLHAEGEKTLLTIHVFMNHTYAFGYWGCMQFEMPHSCLPVFLYVLINAYGIIIVLFF